MAVGYGVAIYVTGGMASVSLPIGAKAIATWIGGLGTGLKGGAALNHGLALLGGGSVAAGGLGKAGGAAVLSAALVASTEVALLPAELVYDAVVVHKEREYSYSHLVEQSKGVSTLPLPKNDSGSEAYEDAMEILEGINVEALLSAGSNRTILKRAIHRLRWSSDAYGGAMEILEDINETLPLAAENNQQLVMRAINKLLYDSEGVGELEDAALLSLLYFILNDYKKAHDYAGRAREIAQAEDENGYSKRSSLPTFISATSALYHEEFDWSSVFSQFEDSMLSDPDNRLVPLLFSIFLDRMELRLSDGYLHEETLLQVFQVMKTPSLEEFRLENYILLLARYLRRLEFEGQKIQALVNTENSTIKGDSKTLATVRDSLDTYRTLLNDGDQVVSWIAVFELENDEDRENVAKFSSAFNRYSRNSERLGSLVEELEEFQSQNRQRLGRSSRGVTRFKSSTD